MVAIRYVTIRQDKNFLKSITMKTLAEVSKQTLQIEAVLRNAKPGDFITYKNLEILSGVRMDIKGKSYMRSALNRLKMEYTPRPGEGIELACPENSIQLVSKRVVRIDNSVKRAEKTTKRVVNQFYDKLNEHEQKNVNYLSAVFGSLRAYSQSAKLFFKKSEHKAIN